MPDNVFSSPTPCVAAFRPQISVAGLPFPRLLQVEVTTRCNMRCAMCVKSAPGCSIAEASLSLETFQKLSPALAHCEKLVLNGIGEPLMHPQLPEFVAFAREHMTADAEIGFQSNGLLFIPDKARALVRAGLDTVCISVDAVDAPEESAQGGVELHGQQKVRHLEQVFGWLRAAASELQRPLRLGVEFVLMADTLPQLPKVAAWAAGQGACFMIVSHMLPYDEKLREQSLFNPNTPAATALFAQWQGRALQEGLDFHDYLPGLWKYGKSDPEKRMAALAEGLQEEARQKDIWLHIRSLLEWDRRDMSGVRAVCAEAERIARETGLDLRMPAMMALDQRRCRFVADGAALITAQGEVCPCQFLWHGSVCQMDGGDKHLRPCSFGNLTQADFAGIWGSTAYTKFRNEVLEDDYPHCSNCPFVPCEDISCRTYAFEHDCLGAAVPCGHCPWNMGALQCLL